MPITGRRRSSIEGFEDYIIVEGGIIYNLMYDIPEWGVVRCVSTRVDRAGYVSVRLNRDGKTYTRFVHRLLAEHFVTNPDHMPEVNHRDGVKTNNSLDNLEWVSHKSNTQHAYDLGLIRKRTRKVVDTNTGIIYDSAKAAAIDSGLPLGTLKGYLCGNRINTTSLRYLEDSPIRQKSCQQL